MIFLSAEPASCWSCVTYWNTGFQEAVLTFAEISKKLGIGCLYGFQLCPAMLLCIFHDESSYASVLCCCIYVKKRFSEGPHLPSTADPFTSFAKINPALNNNKQTLWYSQHINLDQSYITSTYGSKSKKQKTHHDGLRYYYNYYYFFFFFQQGC